MGAVLAPADAVPVAAPDDGEVKPPGATTATGSARPVRRPSPTASAPTAATRRTRRLPSIPDLLAATASLHGSAASGGGLGRAGSQRPRRAWRRAPPRQPRRAPPAALRGWLGALASVPSTRASLGGHQPDPARAGPGRRLADGTEHQVGALGTADQHQVVAVGYWTWNRTAVGIVVGRTSAAPASSRRRGTRPPSPPPRRRPAGGEQGRSRPAGARC